MKQKLLAILLLGCLAITSAFAQNKTVTGKVTGAEDGLPLPGVSVKAKGSTQGIQTNVDGTYKLTIDANIKTLVFTYIGYTTQEVSIANKSVIDVKLNPDSKQLNEVVVVGYGTTTKKAFTGASTTIKAVDIEKVTDANPIKALQGNVPGLQMNSGSGQPGAPVQLFIRGRSSINSGTQPLYVIDGVPMSGNAFGMRASESQTISPLSGINANDIETMSVLKDAAATSIYGARAANGVILITTKKGKGGATRFNFSAKVGFEAMPSYTNKYKLVGRDKFLDIQTRGLINSGDATTVAEAMDIIRDPDNLGDEGADTDWMKAVTRRGKVREYNFDVQGGGIDPKAVRFFVSGNYYDNEGIVIGKGLTRYSGRMNLEQSPSKFVKFGVNTVGSYAAIDMGAGGGYYSDPITLAYTLDPIHKIKNDDGTWNFNTPGGYNPVAQRSDKGDKSHGQQYKATITPFVTLNFTDDLSFTSRGGVDYYNLKEFGYWSFLQPQGKSIRGMGEEGNTTRTILNWANTLNYNKTFGGKHNVNMLIGQEVQKNINEYAYLSATNYPNDQVITVGNAAVPGSASTTKAIFNLSSFFFNGEYSYADKYYVSASGRADGSSRFGSDKRWAGFYSAGLKYRVSNEDFMSTTKDWLTDLTIRSSYGTSGNQDVGSTWYASRDLFDFGYNYNGLPGMAHQQFGNRNLSWESTAKFNVGLDIKVFDRVSLEFDYYRNKTNDMVFNVPVSMTTGLSNNSKNIGQLENKGFELGLNVNILKSKDIQWDFGVNASINRNKVLRLSNSNPIEGATTIIEVGRSLNTFKMKEWAGVDPTNGDPLWYKGTSGTETTNNYNLAGKRYLGESNPKMQGGFNTSLRVANFDFSAQFNYSIGGKLYGNNLRYDEQNGSGGFAPVTNYIYDNAWTTPGQITNVPKYVYGDASGSSNASSRFLMDADYLKIRSIVVGYTLPKRIVNQIKVANVRVYASADNIYTFSAKNFRGFDPSGITSDGIQWWNYPSPRNFIVGINVGF